MKTDQPVPYQPEITGNAKPWTWQIHIPFCHLSLWNKHCASQIKTQKKAEYRVLTDIAKNVQAAYRSELFTTFTDMVPFSSMMLLIWAKILSRPLINQILNSGIIISWYLVFTFFAWVGPRITIPRSLRWASTGAVSLSGTTALLVRLFSPECEPQNIAAYDRPTKK